MTNTTPVMKFSAESRKVNFIVVNWTIFVFVYRVKVCTAFLVCVIKT